MKKSTILTIKDRIYQKLPEIPPEEIDLILKLYFKRIRQDIVEMQKPEIATTWGSLVAKRGYLRKRQGFFNQVLATPRSYISERVLNACRVMLVKIKGLLEIKKVVEEKGKTVKSKQRRYENFKEFTDEKRRLRTEKSSDNSQ